MPWRTFLQASVLLIAVWVCGALWSCVRIFLRMDIPLTPVELEAEGYGPTEPAFAFDVARPSGRFTPRGLACHPALGDSLLVLERYGVHEVRPDGRDGTGYVQATVMQCLEQQPEFLASGLQSIGVECAVGEHAGCAVVLQGFDEGTFLRCSLSPGGGTPVRLTMHGEGWRGLAAGGDGNFWTLRRGGLVELEPRAGFPREFVPRREVPYEDAEEVTHLHGLVQGGRPTAVLGLQLHGARLLAWPLAGGEHLAWRLPLDRRWVGACALAGELFLVGVWRRDGAAGMWRSRLPRELRAGAP